MTDVPDPSRSDRQGVLSVSQLTARVKETLENAFPSVWVSGEISNLARPQSGHVYLTLKDEHAQLRAVMWRRSAGRLRFALEDGLQVVCEGEIDVYAPRGSYQLVIRRVEPVGAGALQLALRRLHEKLAAEGLFDSQRKRELPPFPRRVAFVTSPTGAAIRDFLEVVRRRWRLTEIVVIPTRVQGDGAAEEIVAGIRAANRLRRPPDVLVVGRGGGSLEDLWCFNEEIVVRAIFASRIPVISAVGHEIDVTLADLVADLRALTPSEAAERVVPSSDEVLGELTNLDHRLAQSLRTRIGEASSRLNAAAAHRVFRRPHERVHDLARWLDERQIQATRAVRQRLAHAHQCVAAGAGKLDSLSPLAVLGRGYSLTVRARDGQLVRDAATLSVGEQITTRLAYGHTVSRVEQVDSGSGR